MPDYEEYIHGKREQPAESDDVDHLFDHILSIPTASTTEEDEEYTYTYEEVQPEAEEQQPHNDGTSGNMDDGDFDDIVAVLNQLSVG